MRPIEASFSMQRSFLSALFLVASCGTMFVPGLARAQSAPHPPPGHGQMMAGSGRNADASAPDPSLAPHTILVRVVDGSTQLPAAGATVDLVTVVQSIQDGDSKTLSTKVVGPDGQVTFSGLDTSIRNNYSVKVQRDGARYAVPEFRLGKTGHHVLIHVYPVTSNMREAFVGFRGLTYVQMREDNAHITVMYRVLNMGRRTFLPQGITLDLPADAFALDVESKMGDAGFEKTEHGVRLVGTYPPGSRDLQFSFQLKNHNQSEVSWTMSVPPHLAEQRVLVEDVPGMELRVAGFEPAEATTGPDGKKVLFAQRVMRPGEGELNQLRIELSGLPVIGPGRWVATALAASIGIFGLGLGLFRRRGKQNDDDDQRLIAQQVLLQEMRLLERAHAQDQVGPRTYEQTRREIMMALARLEA
jgi:hypothetical protein